MGCHCPVPSETGALPAAKQYTTPSKPAYVHSGYSFFDLASFCSFAWAVLLVRPGVKVAAVTHSHYVRTLCLLSRAPARIARRSERRRSAGAADLPADVSFADCGSVGQALQQAVFSRVARLLCRALRAQSVSSNVRNVGDCVDALTLASADEEVRSCAGRWSASALRTPDTPCPCLRYIPPLPESAT